MGTARKASRVFNAEAFLSSSEGAKRRVDYAPATVIFAQGDPADTVLYIQQGSVKLSVLSQAGKEAVVGVLGPGDFFGEGALAGQPVRLATATSMTISRILLVPKRRMIRLLQQQHALSNRFIAHMLARNIRLEEDLVDQLFNASEKRLARTLLLLARYGKPDGPRRALPKLSQEVLAEIVGTTRSRVNFFMNKFRRLGFIDYNSGGVKVHHALLSVVLHDSRASDR
jgi:CRP/FNR family transcriptional regulator, cyclic AMP receptor protein